MKAKLFLRGVREPVELEQEEAVAAQKLIASSSDPKTPFSIEGVIATKKEDMKFVVFGQKEQERVFETVEMMAENDAKLFEYEMIEPRADAVFNGFHEYDGPEFYLKKMGAVRLEFYGEGKRKGYTVIVKNPQLYKELSMKLDSYKKWKGRKDYVEKSRLTQLGELAKAMKV